MCDGRPDGQCPDKRCDRSVHLSQAGLLLCDSCERFPFPELFQVQNRSSTRGAKQANNVGLPTAATSTSTKNKTPVSSKPCSDSTEVKTPVDDDLQSHTAAALPRVIFNELLMYVSTFRNCSSIEKIRKVILHFYTSVEISDAQKSLISTGGDMLTGCAYLTERRTSTQRSASDAEVDHIIHYRQHCAQRKPAGI